MTDAMTKLSELVSLARTQAEELIEPRSDNIGGARVDAAKTLSELCDATERLERENAELWEQKLARLGDKWSQWPNGDAGDAIDWALDHCSSLPKLAWFLEDWRGDDLEGWPEYLAWLKVQRDAARASLSPSVEKKES